MARTNPQTRLQALHREARKQQQQIQRIQNSRKFAVRRLTKSNLESNGPSGIQGGIAADEDNCLWVQIDGVWQELVCGGGGPIVPTLTGPIIIQGDNAIDFYTDLYSFDPENAAAGINVIVPADRPNFTYPDGTGIWNADFSKLYFIIDGPYGGASNRAYWYHVNPDGSEMTEAYHNPTILYFNVTQRMIHRLGDGRMYASHHDTSTGFGGLRTLNTIDLDAGVELESFQANVVAGKNSFSGQQLHPDGTKYAVEMTGITRDYYIVNIDGTDPTFLHLNYYDPGRPAEFIWNPLGNGQLAYRNVSHPTYPNGIRFMNEDGSGHLPAWEPGTFVHDFAFSPDGSKIAALAGEILAIVDTTGSGTPFIIDGGPRWYDTLGEIDWSPDGTQVVVTVWSDTEDAIDIADVNTGEITVAFSQLGHPVVDSLYGQSWGRTEHWN